MKTKTEEIWVEFRTQLKQFILKRVSDESMADDILQDVFVKIHSQIETLKDDTKIQSWIYKITRNTIIDHYRTRKINTEIPDTVPLLDKIPENVDIKKGFTSVKSMIRDLPYPYNEALLLTEVEGLSQKELADQCGISISGANSRVQRARQLLDKKLKGYCRMEYNRHGSVVDYQCTEAFSTRPPKNS